MQSESIENLAKSLIKLQGALKPAFRNASNPFFKSKYADLESVINSAKNLLLENGLAISQPAISEGEKIGVQTILMHESGEWIDSKILFAVSGKNIAQAGGSIISYARRYAYASILGVVTGEDNDAQDKKDKRPDNQPNHNTLPPSPIDAIKVKNETGAIMRRLGCKDTLTVDKWIAGMISSGLTAQSVLEDVRLRESNKEIWNNVAKMFVANN